MLLVRLGDVEHLHLSSQLLHHVSLFFYDLFYLHDSLLESNFHDDKLVLWLLLKQLHHLVHRLCISSFTPANGLFNDIVRVKIYLTVSLVVF